MEIMRRLQLKEAIVEGHREGFIAGLVVHRSDVTIKWRARLGDPRSTQQKAVAQIEMYLAGMNELWEKLTPQTDSHLQLEVATGGHTPLLE